MNWKRFTDVDLKWPSLNYYYNGETEGSSLRFTFGAGEGKRFDSHLSRSSVETAFAPLCDTRICSGHTTSVATVDFVSGNDGRVPARGDRDGLGKTPVGGRRFSSKTTPLWTEEIADVRGLRRI